jgi:hypothetical protein
MQAAKRAIAFARAACWAGVTAGGPPPGRYFRQAPSAARNCGEAGLASVIATPNSETTRVPPVPPADPREAWSPCDLRHVMSAAVLGLDDADELGVARVVEGRLATDDAFDPPQPAAAEAMPRTAGRRTSMRADTFRRKSPTSKPALNRF